MSERQDWQRLALSARARRARESVAVWVAGPVENLRECVHETRVRLPAVLRSRATDWDDSGHAVRALIDTGCTTTAIRADIAARLGLPTVGFATVHTGSSGRKRGVPCSVVLAEIQLEDQQGRELRLQHEFLTLDMAVELLLGMDVLHGGALSVDLVDGVWEWTRFGGADDRAFGPRSPDSTPH